MTNPKQILWDLSLFILILGAAFLLGILLENISQSQAPVSIIFVLAVFSFHCGPKATSGESWHPSAAF